MKLFLIRLKRWCVGVRGACPRCGEEDLAASQVEFFSLERQTFYCARCFKYRGGHKHDGVFR